MRINCYALLGLVIVVATGCSSDSGAKSTAVEKDLPVNRGADGKSEEAPIVYRHTNSTTTTLLPLEAVRRVADPVLEKNFGFTPSRQRGLFRNAPAGGDRFSAGASAVSWMKEHMVILCRFRSETETTVEFKSNLPAEQHAIVWREIIAELEKPAVGQTTEHQ